MLGLALQPFLIGTCLNLHAARVLLLCDPEWRNFFKEIWYVYNHLSCNFQTNMLMKCKKNFNSYNACLKHVDTIRND